jgi:hypothetical protein
MKKWIVIVVVLILLASGIFAYKYFWQQDKTDQFSSNEEGLSYSGEMGDLDINYTDPGLADFGIPIYPEAKQISDKSTGEVNIGGRKFLMGSFTSSDSKESVISFYKSEIENAVTGTVEDGRTRTIIKSPGGSSVSVSTKDSLSYIVIVKPLQ